MITVEIDNEEYQLPTSWDDITLREFKNILDFEKSRDYNSDLKKSVDLMALLMKCDSDKIYGLHQDNFIALCKNINWAMEEPKGVEGKVIKINDIVYIPPTDLNSITVGEQVSIETIISNDPEDIAGMLSVILRPEKKIFNAEKNIEELVQEPFDIKNYNYRKELFLDNLKITDVIKISNFFLSGGKQSSSITKDISELEEK